MIQRFRCNNYGVKYLIVEKLFTLVEQGVMTNVYKYIFFTIKSPPVKLHVSGSLDDTDTDDAKQW